jgi:8-oxo-dGTP pyrophosphatase MutT (NUDIX family)
VTTFQTYRNVDTAITARIQKTVKNFYETHKVLPASIAVNGQEVDAAREVAEELGLDVPVEVNEGACLGEVWLGEVAKVAEVAE